MIDIKEKRDCCGCGSCRNICPKEAITMSSDREGFLYPFVDTQKCIECGLCEKVCPVLNSPKEVPFQQDAYIAQNKDEGIRAESTSGGVFSAIAEYVINQGGVVFGAAYGDDFIVRHTYVEDVDGLHKFRNSKYVQSNTEGTYQEVQNFLLSGRMVCYSGTPCQIEGLRFFLRKEYSNLLTVDIVCHAVPSPLIWNRYVEMQKGKYGSQISDILFRDKHYGYKYSTMTLKNNHGEKIYAFGIDTDPMLRAFFSNICDRPSCYSCRFKKRYRMADFTIWDCYPVYKFDKSMDDDKGTSRVLIHSDKGRAVFNSISNRLNYYHVDPDSLTENVREMFYSIPQNEKRDDFFRDAIKLSGSDLFEMYFPETARVKVERSIRLLLVKTNTYHSVKKIVARILKK